MQSSHPDLSRSNASKQRVELQILDLRFPLARTRQRDSPTAVFHLFKQCSGLVLCVVYVGRANDEGGEVEHDEGKLRVDVVLDVVLPGVGGGGAIERCKQMSVS